MLMNETLHTLPHFPFVKCLVQVRSRGVETAAPGAGTRQETERGDTGARGGLLGGVKEREKTSFMEGTTGERAKFLERGPCKACTADVKK